jgi:hypothetical protein
LLRWSGLCDTSGLGRGPLLLPLLVSRAAFEERHHFVSFAFLTSLLFYFPNSSFEFTFLVLISGRVLLEKRSLRIVREGQGWFGRYFSGRLLSELFALEVALEGVEEETVVRDGKPAGKREKALPRGERAVLTSKRPFASSGCEYIGF